MSKKFFRQLGISLIVGTLVGGLATIASAASTTGSWGYYGPLSGYSYQNQASLSENGSSNPVNATTRHENQASGTVPAGYMGAKARLYLSDGTLCKQSTTVYNSSAVNGQVIIDGGDCGSGAYYSKGATEAYNGNGYSLYTTFQSPNLNH